MQKFRIDHSELSRAILGCDSFVSWLYQGGDSLFRDSKGELRTSRVFEVMKVCVNYGVTGIDLSPPLMEVFKRIQAEADKEIVGLGALQEWKCNSFTIDGIPLESYSKEVKASIKSKLPHGYLEGLIRSTNPGNSFVKPFFFPDQAASPLSQAQIDRISINPDFFIRRLELYRQLNLELVQFGGLTADWLVTLGRTDLLERLSKLIRSEGFTPLLTCHWTSIVLPVAERELEVAGYIVPLNKSWGMLTLSEALGTIKKIEKPIIAMKILSLGALVNDLFGAFEFIFKKANVAAVMVGVSSKSQAKRTFSTIAKVLRKLEAPNL